MPTPTSKASCWGCGIARARTACGSESRRSKCCRTNRSSAHYLTSRSTRFAGSPARVPMHSSSIVIDTARQLAAAGRHAEVVEYLGAQPASELADSPSLALLYGTAHARLGRHDEGQRWLDLALDLARKRDEQAVERDSLNARGAIALVSGRIDEAADYFTQALLAASRDGDAVTTGRCSNNLGIISSLRGRHAEAIGSWEIAAAAFDRAGLRRGVAECQHNQAIAYREQGELDKALAAADRAVAHAEADGDHTLRALTHRGRAEIRVARRELEQARRELDQVREIRSGLRDTVGEAEDLRVAASLLLAEGQPAAAEVALREVIARAEPHGRPQLLAEATRDLALLLRRSGRTSDAQTAARRAKAVFTRLGAEGEIRNLANQDWDDDFAAELRGSLAPLNAAQALADAGLYAELLSYLSKRSPDELLFFQAEDGIRDYKVTGVQTCALPISSLTCICRQLQRCRAAHDAVELINAGHHGRGMAGTVGDGIHGRRTVAQQVGRHAGGRGRGGCEHVLRRLVVHALHAQQVGQHAQHLPAPTGFRPRVYHGVEALQAAFGVRSEERRVGEECRSRWAPDH